MFKRIVCLTLLASMLTHARHSLFVALWLPIVASSMAAQDVKAYTEVLESAKKDWRAAREFSRKLQGKGRNVFKYTKGKEVIGQGSTEKQWRQKNGYAVFIAAHSQSVEGTESMFESAYGLNPKYGFKLDKTNNGAWILNKLEAKKPFMVGPFN